MESRWDSARVRHASAQGTRAARQAFDRRPDDSRGLRVRQRWLGKCLFLARPSLAASEMAVNVWGKVVFETGLDGEKLGKVLKTLGKMAGKLGREAKQWGKPPGNWGRRRKNWGRSLGNWGRRQNNWGEPSGKWGTWRRNRGRSSANWGRRQKLWGQPSALTARCSPARKASAT